MTTPSAQLYLEIRLTKGMVARVSHRVFFELVQFKWSARWDKSSRSFYAVRAAKDGLGRWRTVYMHRQILGLEHGDRRQADHQNHDTLDNTDDNLRIANSARENQYNQNIRRDSTTGYKGVTLRKHSGMFSSEIRVNGKRHRLGCYRTAKEAHLAYCYAAAYYFGEFACFE